MSTLVIFNDTDTGCDLGYIHTNDEMPTVTDIENAMNSEGETMSDLRFAGEMVSEGNCSVVLVRYNSNGWGDDLLPQVGTLTFFKSHARSETPGNLFTIR